MNEIVVSEEDVKFKFLVPYLKERGYKDTHIAFNVAVDVQEGRKKKTIFADAIVYSAATHKAPLLVCETKAPSEILDKSVREQAISYARLLPKIAPLALITNGSQVQVFHTLNKTRISELPKRSELQDDIVKFVLDKDVQDALRQEAKHDLFIIDDVRTFKSILRTCHSEIRNNEGMDPTAAFDEMSKVMFCKLYEEKENHRKNRFRVSVFDDTLQNLNINVVSKIFDEAKTSKSYSGLFLKDSKIHLKDRTVRKIVEKFEGYDLGLTAFDVKGEAFEYFLGENFTGGLGEFFTPRNVVEFMVDAINPKIGEKIIDPFCGTGGFLIYAFDTVCEKIRLQEFSEAEKKKWRTKLSDKCLFGTDWKERTSQACKMNMMVHGDGSSGIFMHDGFADVPGFIEAGKFDVCLTNPPFGSFETDPEMLQRYELGANRKSQDRIILAVERCLNLLKPGGRTAAVVIDGVLNNASTKNVRDYIKKHAWIKAVISLNKETFEGYGARAKTSIIVLEKKQEAEDAAQAPVFMAIAGNTGLAPNGAAIAGNVLPDILLDLKAFLRGDDIISSVSGAWTTELRDRLDAENYAPFRATVTADIADLRAEMDVARARVIAAQNSLSDVETTLSEVKTTPHKLSELLEQYEDRQKLNPEDMYRLLGVRWWGEGSFVREEKRGKAIKATALWKVCAGHIVYNRLFAFRGSFAIIPSDQDGCFASNEFPTFQVKSTVADRDMISHYIVQCLNSPQYLARVDADSTGSTKTSRNRFNEKQFLDLTIHLPEGKQALKSVIGLLTKSSEMRKDQERLFELTKAFRDNVLGMLPKP